ncbi:hypothetical protein S7711_05981 [Stachybotrys chartarum IBT 7711]|uniref:Uncharacterized protein n=1 Tax=Stachybotrys chartarum (strain CBS 109288 / IBT 7711) TaxID=1280523 RepID=A0A084B2R1_STACB|nr:hypothetical protein S7711_05981 [Stachybotrys chartarum IBT 7711]
MAATTSALTAEEKEFFRENGYLHLKNCFSREQAQAVTHNVWTRLGMDPHDKTTWTSSRVHMPSHNTFDPAEFAPKAWAAITELCGGEDRISPENREWRDGLIVNLGSPEFEGKELPLRDLDGWHVDGDFFVHYLDSREQGLLVIPLFTDIVENGGGTVICPEAIPRIAKHLHDHPEGVSPRMEPRGHDGFSGDKNVSWYQELVQSCQTFVEATGECGDVYLLHPLMLHSASHNPRRALRIITNPPITLKDPFCFNRPDGDYSIVEQTTLRALGKRELADWKIAGPREMIVPERVKIQARIKEEELRRMKEIQRAGETAALFSHTSPNSLPLSPPFAPRLPNTVVFDMSQDDDYEVDVPDLDADDSMKAFLPTSFGKKSKEADIAAQIERSRRTTAQTKDSATAERSQKPPKKSDSSDDDSDDSDDSNDEDKYPLSHELVLKTHERTVTSVTVDPAGGRLATASLDCTIKLHDFASMTPTTLRAFKSVDPFMTKPSAANSESHPIHHVQFNPLAGGVVLCIAAHPQARILSRDGEILTEFVKGDMYLRDMHNTKGHISEITTGAWHPADKNLCVTAGTDSTLRIWDINNKRSQKEVVVFKSKAAGSAGRTKMTAVAWGNPAQGGNNILVAAALDGSLVMYSGNGPFSRPAGEIRDAHRPQTWTGGIDISSDGRMVVSRGGDDLIKLWDTRKFNKPLVSVSHPSTSDHYPTSNIRYSPNSTSIITGSATGHVHILNPGNLRSEYSTPITPGSPLITVEWHPKINQIITGSANSETHVLYNPDLSSRGAVEVMSRAPKKRHIDDNPELTMDQTLGLSGDAIITPGAAGSRKAGVTLTGRSKDPRRPAIPTQTPFQRNQPDEKQIAENIPLSRMLHEDPREALLKYADKAQSDPVFTKAWSQTQPQTQYADISDEEEEGPDKKKLKK